MRKFLLATAIAAVAATNAQAAETTGTVRGVNTRSDSVTLSRDDLFVARRDRG